MIILHNNEIWLIRTIEFNIIRLLVNYMLVILVFVNHDMLLKVASLSKHLATHLAYIWFITGVKSLFSIYAVSLNIPLLIKQNSYYLTKRKIAKSTWEIALSMWEIAKSKWKIAKFSGKSQNLHEISLNREEFSIN